MTQTGPGDNWATIRERLKRAAQAIAFSKADVERREAAAMQARTRDLARRPRQRGEQSKLVELVTFRLGRESYAIEAKYVHQILPYPPVTAVPRTPEFLLGVSNLRGEILAVFDLNRLFGLGPRHGGAASRMIVLGEAQAQFGFVADAVEQVKILDPADLASPEALFGLIRPEAVLGVASDALMVLDGKALLADERLLIEQRDEGAGG
jgi:purine-binding chemotaxis protein CheW